MLTSKSSSNNRLRAQLREAFKRGYKKALNEAKPPTFAKLIQARAQHNDASDIAHSSGTQRVGAVVVSGYYSKRFSLEDRPGFGWSKFQADTVEQGIAEITQNSIKIDLDSDYINITPNDVIDADWVGTNNMWGRGSWSNGVYYLLCQEYLVFIVINGDVHSVKEMAQNHLMR